MKPKFMAATLAVAILLSIGHTPVQAHGAVVSQDTCILNLGPNKILFSGYQPNSRGNTKFCDDVPDTGKTVIVLDLADQVLRQIAIGIKFVKNVDIIGDPDKDGRTVFEVPSQVYSGGTMRVDHTFPADGFFVGIVTGKTPQGESYIARFPFAVGEYGLFGISLFRDRSVFWMLLGGMAAFALGVGAFIMQTRRHSGSAQ